MCIILWVVITTNDILWFQIAYFLNGQKAGAFSVNPQTLIPIEIPESRVNEKGDQFDLGKRLRDLRTARSMTIRALAEKSGVSVNTLSMIENGKTSPSVSTLLGIARVFEIPIAEFFNQKPTEKKVVVSSGGHRQNFHASTSIIERLTSGLEGNVLESALITLPPGGVSGKATVVHSGYEFAFILKGKLLYIIDNRHYLLEAGDSIAFICEQPHSWQNIHNDETQFLFIVVDAKLDPHKSRIDNHLQSE